MNLLTAVCKSMARFEEKICCTWDQHFGMGQEVLIRRGPADVPSLTNPACFKSGRSIRFFAHFIRRIRIQTPQQAQAFSSEQILTPSPLVCHGESEQRHAFAKPGTVLLATPSNRSCGAGVSTQLYVIHPPNPVGTEDYPEPLGWPHDRERGRQIVFLGHKC
jgi:hypothetical protein